MMASVRASGLSEKVRRHPVADEVIPTARTVRLRNAGLHVEALNDALKARLAVLDDDELAVLQSVKEKLNSGLDASLRAAADTVGGFIW